MVTKGRFWKVVYVLVALIVGFVLLTFIAMDMTRATTYRYYTTKLDAWVKAGGQIEQVQHEVVRNCGMLVMTQATDLERIELMTIYRDEFDFRVDVCTKLTANRVYKQPEFENPQITKMICEDTNPYHELFPKLCHIAGISAVQ